MWLLVISIKKYSAILQKDNLSIPYYQRPYSWNKNNVNQLIDDLILLFDGGGDPSYSLECFYSDSRLAYSRNGANCSSQLGNETAKLEFIKIYPTVVTNELNILNAENYTYEIINYLGQVLLQGQIESQHETLMLKDMMKGTFIIRLKLGNRITKHYKFVVE